MTKQEALDKIKELEQFIKNIDDIENDKLFLLSIDEYEAMKDKIETLPYCWWWLRSPGRDQNYTAGVYRGSSVNCPGYNIYNDNGCIRPAFKIKKGVDTVLPVYQGNVIQYGNMYDYIGQYNECAYYLARYPYTSMVFGETSDYKTSEVRKYLLELVENERKTSFSI